MGGTIGTALVRCDAELNDFLPPGRRLLRDARKQLYRLLAEDRRPPVPGGRPAARRRNPGAARHVGDGVAARGYRLVALGVAAATSALLAVAPVIVTSSCTTSVVGGVSSCTSGRQSLLASEGAGVLIALAVPVLLAAVPVAVRTRRAAWVAAGALTVAVLLGLASIGLFFVPAAALAWVAAARPYDPHP